MICVYPADCTDFSTNGNGTVEPISALVTETLNGEYELTLVHRILAADQFNKHSCHAGTDTFRWRDNGRGSV